MIYLSIIIPVYNRENYIMKCINSIQMINSKQIEIIIIDDGSQDRSLEICQQLMKNDSRIKLVSQQNAGVSSARNLGLKNASGKYIMFVDSDDMVLSETINYFLSMDTESDIYLFDYYMIDSICNKYCTCLLYTSRSVKHVLYLSNFIRSKGYPEVLELARIEKERCEQGEQRKLHFDFAGKFFEESEKRFFFDYIKEYRLDDYVTYHGVVGGNKKRALLNKCDIFVLLTRYPNEGQPISILEAMGNAMMIVTTDHAGIPDIVKDGENGIVVHTYKINVDDVYAKIVASNICEFAINNRQNVNKMYVQKRYIENMEECFIYA